MILGYLMNSVVLLYYDGEINLTTIKYLTSDFDNVLNNLEIINTTFTLENTII